MKIVLMAILSALLTSAHAADCKVELDHTLYMAHMDYSETDPRVLVRILQRKGYKVRAHSFAHDFDGEANMKITADIGNAQTYRLNKDGEQVGYFEEFAKVKLMALPENEVLATAESTSLRKGIIHIFYPKHPKKALKKLPSCKQL